MFNEIHTDDYIVNSFNYLSLSIFYFFLNFGVAFAAITKINVFAVLTVCNR